MEGLTTVFCVLFTILTEQGDTYRYTIPISTDEYSRLEPMWFGYSQDGLMYTAHTYLTKRGYRDTALALAQMEKAGLIYADNPSLEGCAKSIHINKVTVLEFEQWT